MPAPDWAKILDFTVEALIAFAVTTLGGYAALKFREWKSRRSRQKFAEAFKQFEEQEDARKSKEAGEAQKQALKRREIFLDVLHEHEIELPKDIDPRQKKLQKRLLTIAAEDQYEAAKQLLTKIDEEELTKLMREFRLKIEAAGVSRQMDEAEHSYEAEEYRPAFEVEKYKPIFDDLYRRFVDKKGGILRFRPSIFFFVGALLALLLYIFFRLALPYFG